MTTIFSAIGAGLIIIATTVAGWLGYSHPLGATIPVTVAVFETTLASAISTADTSMTLVTGTDKSGDALNGYLCFTVNGGKTNEEFVCGTASGTVVTAMIRGLDPVNAGAVPALAKTHRAGENIKITDFPQLAIVSRILNGDESLPNKIYYATDTISINSSVDIPTKKYVDSVATSGAPNADFSTAGLSEIATGTELAAGTTLGGSGAYLVVPSALVSQTSSAGIIPFTNASGKLSTGFIDQTANYTWSGVQTIATSTTANKFNLIPAGVVQAYVATSSPDGWLLCDGSYYTTSSYPNLYSVIGTSYGSATSSNYFRVPDLRGRQIIGYGSSTPAYGTTTATVDTLGKTGGEQSHTQLITELVSHTHYMQGAAGGSDAHSGLSTNNPTTIPSGATGGGQPFNVLDPYIVLNYIIKY
jgi:microcystin-dependent protein